MKIIESKLKGVYEIQNQKIEDKRGQFVKTFHEEFFKDARLNTNFKESFFSISRKGVLRGMHFQLPPHDHEKLVFVTEGEILDVAVDVRKGSESFKQYFSAKLSSDNAKAIYIGKGFAHGFLTLSDSATVVYLTTSLHSPDHDMGVHWDSFGFNWGLAGPVVSQRDSDFFSIENL